MAWRRVPGRRAALLAWPSRGRLYAVDAAGRVAIISDAGHTWSTSGEAVGEPEAVTAAGRELFVVLGDGSVVSTSDGGRSWRVRVPPSTGSGPPSA